MPVAVAVLSRSRDSEPNIKLCDSWEYVFVVHVSIVGILSKQVIQGSEEPQLRTHRVRLEGSPIKPMIMRWKVSKGLF